MVQSVDQIVASVERLKLVPPSDLATIRSRWFRADRGDANDLKKFSQWAIVNHLLTDFQVKMLATGRAEKLSLNQYNLRDHITSGPFNGSFLAVDPLQRQVVLEVLSGKDARDSQFLKRLQQAIEKTMKVKHANVGRVLDHGQAQDLHYVVKEYSQGETLASVLKRRGKLQPLQAARIFALALAGMQALHQEGVSAGDLNANNLMLTAAKKNNPSQRTVKILHAGLRRQLFDEAAIGGSLFDIVPEDLPLSTTVSLKPIELLELKPVDEVFRLGCVFYECLTGKAPYDAADLPTPKRPAPSIESVAPGVPDMLASVVEQMISPDPEERPRQAAHAAKLLRVFLASEEDTKHRPAEENVVVPSPAVKDSPVEEEEEEVGDAPERDLHSKVQDVWTDIKPKERDLVFLSLGALGVVLILIALRLITGWQFMNLVCLIAGIAMSFFVERFVRWREEQSQT